MGYLIAYILGIISALKPFQSSIDSVNPGNKSRQENHGTDSLVTLVPQIPPSKGNTENPCKCCHHKMPWWGILLDVLTFIAASTAAGAAIYYASITHSMWIEMQTQTQTGKKELALSQRSYVEITNPVISQQQQTPPTTPVAPYQPMLQNIPYDFIVTAKVYGSVPALHTYSRMNPRFVAITGALTSPFVAGLVPPPLESCASTAKWEDSSVAYFPNGTYSFSSSERTSEDDIKKLIHAKEALFWIGCLRYEDGFKRRYQTNFCFYWSIMDQPLGWRRCLHGNDLIDYPEVSQEK